MKLVQVLKPEFYCKDNKKFTIKEMKKNKSVQKAFKLFEELLPDHPNKDNTEIHFLLNDEGIDLFWVCKHFEHGGKDDLVSISAFLTYLITEFSYDNEGRVVYLDDNWEKLVLLVYNINNESMINVFDYDAWRKEFFVFKRFLDE